MKRLATATIQPLPLTRKRLTTIPRRINGLYRLSIVSREPFEVDIGGTWLPDVRTLDVFHEAPMFIDGLENAGAVDVLSRGESARMIQIFPLRKTGKLEFRITAYDVMPERAELECRKKLASVQTPLEYEGFVKHSVYALQELAAEEAEDTRPNSALDAAATVIAVGLLVGTGALLVAGLAGTISALAVASAPAYTVATAAPACCPARTYVNGKLFKNLREVGVKLAVGRVVGYASP